MFFEDDADSGASPLEESISIPKIAPWAIILAGGEGERMRPFIKTWLGDDRPKQYCAFVGSRSMVQHTLDRASSFVPRERTILIIRDGHRHFLDEALNGDRPGLIIEQPADRGTAAAVFVALAHVLNQDAGATVLIMPSDHFVHPEERFVRYAARACLLAAHLHGHMVLIGALPERADTDHGWIMPGPARGLKDPGLAECGVLPVAAFHEKPSAKEAMHLLEHGALISTMVTAAEGQFLWALGKRVLPRMMSRFEAFRRGLQAASDGAADAMLAATSLNDLYQDLEAVDFSRDLLEQARRWSFVLRMDDILWSDWGRPERIMGSLDRLGRQLFTQEIHGDPGDPSFGFYSLEGSSSQAGERSERN